MNRKLIVGSIGLSLVGLAGVGLYRMSRARQNGAAGELEQWTTADMPDLTGKVMVVTGANSGIGYEAAKEFARKGARTILACRNMDKAQAALAEIQSEMPDAPAEIMQLDLASQASIHNFAKAFHEKYDRLDVLVNNAGIMAVPYATTVDGFESQIGTNHLGHFALTGLLIDVLLATPGARVVTVSSNGHRRGELDFDNLLYEDGEGYDPQKAYSRSKLANLLFTYQLQSYFQDRGADAIAVAAHPGISATNLADHMMERWYIKMAMPLAMRMVQSAAMGALPILCAAVDPAAQGGEYYGPAGSREFSGYPVIVQPSEAARNVADMEKLWQVSEELTGVTFGPALE